MFSNKRLCLSEVQSNENQNYRRDSFSDRVCDDLSEVILKYLSFEDKLRLECVSKQFQRSVLNSKYSFDSEIFQKSNEKLKHLFKKFQNSKQFIFFTRNQELIETIIKYSKNITHIHFPLKVVIEENILKKFFDKFGKNLCFSTLLLYRRSFLLFK